MLGSDHKLNELQSARKTHSGQVQNTIAGSDTGGKCQKAYQERNINNEFLPETNVWTLQKCNGKVAIPGNAIHSTKQATKQTAEVLDIDRPPSSEEVQESMKMSCSNVIFRTKILKTMLLLWNATSMGWLFGQIGPTFPDLQYLAGISLKQGSWLFTSFAVGYLAGCLMAGIILSKFNANISLFVFTIIGAFSIALIPWVPIFPVMVCLRILSGIAFGVQDTGTISMIFDIWGSKVGPFNQMIYVLMSVGGVVSPLVTKPFLRIVPGEHRNELNNTETTNSTTLKNLDLLQNSSESTSVHYALLLTGFIYITVAVLFFISYLKENPVKSSKEKKNGTNDKSEEKKLPNHVEKCVMFLMLMIAFLITAALDLFPNFLVTFLIDYLHWTQQEGAKLTSLLFGAFGIGTFLNIFVERYY